LSEEKRIGVDCGGQIVILAVALLGVQEGQLGQREETVRADPGPITPKLGEDAHRVVVEAIGESEPVKRLPGRAAGLPSVEDALRYRAVDILRVGERDADRRGARSRQEENADQRGECWDST